MSEDTQQEGLREVEQSDLEQIRQDAQELRKEFSDFREHVMRQIDKIGEALKSVQAIAKTDAQLMKGLEKKLDDVDGKVELLTSPARAGSNGSVQSQ